jgi:hypothetical protein
LIIFIIVIFKLLPSAFWLLLLCMTIKSPSFAQTAAKPNISSAELAKKMIGNPAFVKNAKGEDFCWNAAYDMGRFLEYYTLTKNTEWLNAGISYYDFLISKLDTDPDGYKGWIGPYEYDPRYWQDALVGDAILFKGLLDFSILVLEDNNLNKSYGTKARAYVTLASRNFAEKWDKRGTWYEDGPYGSYIGFNKFMKPGAMSTWITDTAVTRTGISHPFNKQLDAGQVFLRLYRITGKKEYKDRAQRIYFTLKSHFQYFDGHYCWNYFEPLTPADIDLVKKDTKHGVWVHPFRSGYQAGEVEKIAEAYHYGIVFDEEDIKRIIRTNLDVMWNKDKLNPQFINSNGQGAEKDTTGAGGFKAAYGHGAEAKNTGELWSGLLDFDQTIRDIYALRSKNIVLNSPPGFKRKYAKDPVKVPSVDFSESKALYLATVLPHRIVKGKSSIIISKSWQPGILQIDLYSKTNKVLANLFKGKVGENTFIFSWDGKDPNKKITYKGEYKIRWTIGSGYREFPIAID